jgi:hypothetical protein
MRMLDGFNEGWIEFESGETASCKGGTSLATVLHKLTEPKEVNTSLGAGSVQ